MPLAEYFKFRREQCDRKRFVFRMLIFDVYALICGFGIFVIFYFAQGIMNPKGQMYDVATYGVVSTVCVIWLHHVQVFVHVRNWTYWLVMWLVISIVFLPITLFIAQLPPYVNMSKSIYSQIVPSLHMNAIILFIVGAFSFPIIFHLFVHRLLWYPKFYT